MQELTVKNMSELTAPQFSILRNLMVSEHQEILGKSFMESIEDWESAHHMEDSGPIFQGPNEQEHRMTLQLKRS